MFGPRHLHRVGLMLAALRGISPQSRVLDVACGLGQLAARIRSGGHRAIGADAEFAAALHTLREARVPAVVADAARLPFRDGAFDAITSGETLEHLDDDRGAVRELARVARSGARCVITVPALQSLWTESDDYYEHRRRYSRPELVSLMRYGGFDVERSSYWGFPVMLLYDTLFLLPMNKRRARTESMPMIARAGRSNLLVSLARAAFAIDRLFGFIPFGPGLILTATRR